jgi:proteic killer suppression protein
MLVTFAKPYLRELYETGATSDKKHRFQPQIVQAYARRIYILQEAESPETLYQFHSLNFEALQGSKKGLYSIRVNKQYRIEFEVSQIIENDEVAETKIIVCNIIELSNHYQ